MASGVAYHLYNVTPDAIMSIISQLRLRAEYVTYITCLFAAVAINTHGVQIRKT